MILPLCAIPWFKISTFDSRHLQSLVTYIIAKIGTDSQYMYWNNKFFGFFGSWLLDFFRQSRNGMYSAYYSAQTAHKQVQTSSARKTKGANSLLSLRNIWTIYFDLLCNVTLKSQARTHCPKMKTNVKKLGEFQFHCPRLLGTSLILK